MNQVEKYIKSPLVMIFFLMLFVEAEGRIIYSKSPGGDWQTTTTWYGGVVPVGGDTVVIQSGHTVTLSGNPYNNSNYLFLIVVGTLDLGGTGKLQVAGGSKVVVETGGQILATGNGAQIKIGTGGAEYKGMDDGPITGPAYVSNGHTPASGEGTAGCGCYTPGSIPLPIVLLYFSAEFSQDVVVISWATTSEENFQKFVIERSSTGTNFLPIGEVPGAGRDIFEIETEYTIIDDSPLLGYNYYRLKAVDLDGQFEYFDVRVVKLTGPKLLSIYPNPSSGKAISFVLNFNPSENDQVVLVNSLGVELLRASVTGIDNKLTFDNELSPGVYVLKYLSTDLETSARVVVSH